MRTVAILLLLSSAVPAQSSDRVKVVVRREAAPEGTRVNSFEPSVDYRFNVAFKVVRIAEGKFSPDFVVCAAHSKVLLEARLFQGRDPSGILVELTLAWDDKEKLHRLEDSRIVER